jgi:hypothetical protein
MDLGSDIRLMPAGFGVSEEDSTNGGLGAMGGGCEEGSVSF